MDTGKKKSMAKKKTVEKALNIENILFNCRDYMYFSYICNLCFSFLCCQRGRS